MTVGIEKLRKFQQQHLESQVQCGEELKSVPKAACIKEWALVEIALNLQALNEKLDQFLRQSGTQEMPARSAGSDYRTNTSNPLPRT
jgi:hypothetical protein